MTNTIVDPSQAPTGREPLLLGVEFITPKDLHGKQRYRTEAWRLTNGELVVIVTDNGGTSLMNASEKIAAAIKKHWAERGEPVTIVEDWTAERPFLDEDRFRISAENGGNWPLDRAEWKAKGLPL